jgi:hypothetical protein
MVKNNRTNENDIRDGNAEKARLAASEMAADQNRIREAEVARDHKDDNKDGLDDH